MRRVTLAGTMSLALLVTPSALAASPKLALSPTFGKALQSGARQPVSVTVTQPGEGKSLEAVVALQVRDAQGRQTLYTHPVVLPAGQASGSVTFNVAVPSDVPQLRVDLRDTQGTILATATGDAIPIKSDRLLRILLVGAPDGSIDRDTLEGQELRVARIAGTLHRAQRPDPAHRGSMDQTIPEAQWVSTVAAPVQQLSDQAADYEQFGMIYLGEAVDMSALSEAQRGALGTYVRQGGVLVLRAREVASFTDDFTGGSGGLYWKKVGLGTVVQADRALATSDWTTVAQYGIAPGRVTAREDWRSTLSEAVLGGDSVEAPPFTTVALFLGIYLLVIVPGQYLLLRRLDKREWAWGTTPLLACGFAVAAYHFGSQGRNPSSYHNLTSIIELGANQSQATALAAIGIYSPTRSQYRVSLTGPGALYQAAEVPGQRQELTIDHPGPGQERVVTDFAIPQWSMQSLVAQTPVTLGEGMEVQVRRQGARMVGTVTNRTGHTLHGAVLKSGARQWGWGEFRSGETRHLNLEPLEMGGNGYASNLLAPPVNFSPAIWAIVQRLNGPISNQLRQGRGEPAQAVLVGTMDDELLPVQVNSRPSPARTTVNVVVTHLPLE